MNTTLNNKEYVTFARRFVKETVDQMDFEQLKSLVIDFIHEDLQQYVANDMAHFLYHCRESEVIKNEFLIKLEHTTDEQFFNKFVKQNKGILL